MVESDDPVNRPVLPTVPDDITGHPRPPHAPLRETWMSGVSDTNPNSRPTPPPGQGPLLEYFRQSRRQSVYIGLMAAAILAVVGTVLISRGFGWVGDWFYWALLLGLVIVYFFHERLAVFSAGAQWFKHRKKWVRIYELNEVKIKARGPGWAILVLSDRHGRRVRAPLNQLVQNRELWDLVYNGILHSVCAGCVRTNRSARKLLRLPESVDTPGSPRRAK